MFATNWITENANECDISSRYSVWNANFTVERNFFINTQSMLIADERRLDLNDSSRVIKLDL